MKFPCFFPVDRENHSWETGFARLRPPPSSPNNQRLDGFRVAARIDNGRVQLLTTPVERPHRPHGENMRHFSARMSVGQRFPSGGYHLPNATPRRARASGHLG